MCRIQFCFSPPTKDPEISYSIKPDPDIYIYIFLFMKMQTDSFVSQKQMEAFYIRTLRPALNTERTGH